MNQIEVTGMILLSGPIGENDRRVEILTKEKGRISAFAKGARRQNSPLVSVANPFVFGTFTLYQGRNSYTLVHGKVENYFAELRTDIEGAYYGMYFMELAGHFTREGNEETQMLRLLYQSMRALMNKAIPRDLVRVIFELKTMVIQGEGLEVFQCIKCGTKDTKELVKLFVHEGGICCSNCKSNTVFDKVIWIDSSSLYAMQYITHSSIEKLFTFALSQDVLNKMKFVMEQYLKNKVDKKLKTQEFLELII